METFEDFRARTLKLYGKKEFKITKSYGDKLAWRWIKKNKWLNIGQPITEREFGLIIKSYHKQFIQRLLNGLEVKFPLRMGKLEIRKNKPFIDFIEGKLITNLPIDWKRTLEYWQEDEQANKSKTLIRAENKEVFRILYRKATAKYINKTFYQFSPARGLKHLLRDKARDNKMEAFSI